MTGVGRKVGLGRRCDRRLEFLSIQGGAATGTPRDVDVQENPHPVGGRMRLVVLRRWSRAE